MNASSLERDPYNIIITGVGGQGNVMASRILGSMLVGKGYYVTIGETFGPSQRGGSVMSHLRISRKSTWSPQIPAHRADLIASLEPAEAVRVMAQYGNPDVYILCNSRPIYPVTVTRGDEEYPSVADIKASLRSLASHTIFIDATEEAQKLGNTIFANIILLGAMYGTHLLPLEREDFVEAISQRFRKDQIEINLTAFDRGCELLHC
ncbi:MAG TPA: indolepyruvate oxidoreductase subunit beta [Syntrophales bacterium]|nr:indolepyruvate oxidoreductase subunit beta [Syntrophales bacterium]